MRNILFPGIYNRWMNLTDLQHLQDNTNIGLRGIMAGLLPAGIDTCILSGCEVIKSNNDYDVTAGYIYHSGFVYEVDAHQITTVNVPYWATKITMLPAVPTDNGNGQQAVHEVGKIELVINSNQSGVIAEYTALYRLEQYLKNAAEVGTLQMLKGDADLSLYDVNTGAGFGPCEGWQLLDGRNGYPDLSGAFPMGGTGALAVSGSNSKTITEQNLPAHSHGAGTLRMPDHGHQIAGENGSTSNAYVGGGNNNPLQKKGTEGVNDYWNNSQITGSTDSVGGGQPMDITPKNFQVRYRLRVE